MRPSVTAAVVVTFGAILVIGAGSFAVTPAASTPEPTFFEDTVPVGVTLEEEHAMPPEATAPRAQVFHTRYQYVLGYGDLTHLADDAARKQRTEQFGPELATYVMDFGMADVTLTEDGYPVTDDFIPWIDASEAYFVVDSQARTPAGPTALSFVDQTEAESFAAEYGGTVLSWAAFQDRDEDGGDVAAVRDRVSDQAAWADERVATVEPYRERPVETRVTGDQAAIQAAIEDAPPETTVVVDSGTYQINDSLSVDAPITLDATGAHFVGNDSGSVITVKVDGAAVIGGEISGVGDTARNPDAGTDDEDAWDQNVELGYGHGDAGVAVIDADEVLVADVTIDTPANGVLLRDADHPVVDNVTVRGTDDWSEGFMGVMAMRSPGVIQGSTMDGGRDGVYTHRSDGLVVRNNSFADGRFGIHVMYTSDMLIADNEATGQQWTGIELMTDPRGIAIVDNEVREADVGTTVVGEHMYVAGNLLTNNDRGIQTEAVNSHFERNAIADNRIGIRTATLVPSTTVHDNDFVGNHRHVDGTPGPLRVWTDDDRGNYWDGAAALGATGDRPYVPTGTVDQRVHRVDGAVTLAHSPGELAIRGFRGLTPGLRSGGVIDTNPNPHPGVLQASAGHVTSHDESNQQQADTMT